MGSWAQAPHGVAGLLNRELVPFPGDAERPPEAALLEGPDQPPCPVLWPLTRQADRSPSPGRQLTSVQEAQRPHTGPGGTRGTLASSPMGQKGQRRSNCGLLHFFCGAGIKPRAQACQASAPPGPPAPRGHQLTPSSFRSQKPRGPANPRTEAPAAHARPGARPGPGPGQGDQAPPQEGQAAHCRPPRVRLQGTGPPGLLHPSARRAPVRSALSASPALAQDTK